MNHCARAVLTLAALTFAVRAVGALYSLNSDWRFTKAPKTIPLAQSKASVETNGTLVVTGEATFMPGAVIDVGNLALADGAVVLACKEAEGMENLVVTTNGWVVNYNVKFEASQGGIVLRRKGLVIVFQ